jgi:hypothetical protein
MSRNRRRQIKWALIAGALVEGTLFSLNLLFADRIVEDLPWLNTLQNPAAALVLWAMEHQAVRHFSIHFPPTGFVRAVLLIGFTIQTIVFALEALLLILVFEYYRRNTRSTDNIQDA